MRRSFVVRNRKQPSRAGPGHDISNPLSWYIRAPLTFERFVLTALIPIWFVALAVAVRRFSLLAVAAVIGSGTLLKLAWLFREGESNAWVIVPAVALGMAACTGVRVSPHS